MIFLSLLLAILLPQTISDYPACYEEVGQHLSLKLTSLNHTSDYYSAQGRTWRGSGTWIDGYFSSPASCHSLCKGGYDDEDDDSDDDDDDDDVDDDDVDDIDDGKDDKDDTDANDDSFLRVDQHVRCLDLVSKQQLLLL